MLDPKDLIAHVVNETVKWVAIGLAIAIGSGILIGFFISRHFS